jgi:hypothetical protein
MNICDDAFCGEPNQNQLRELRKEEQYSGIVRDTIQYIDHPSTFWIVEIGPWEKQKSYLIDILTYQIYDPVTGLCQSSDFLKLVDNIKKATKRYRVNRKNNSITQMVEDDCETD